MLQYQRKFKQNKSDNQKRQAEDSGVEASRCIWNIGPVALVKLLQNWKTTAEFEKV